MLTHCVQYTVTETDTGILSLTAFRGMSPDVLKKEEEKKITKSKFSQSIFLTLN